MGQPTDIKVPPLGESVTEATIARWLKQAGDAVQLDEPLVELETDKITLEVNAPAAGVLGKIVATEGSTVGVGDLLGTVDSGAGAQPTAKAAPKAPEPKSGPKAAAPTPSPAPAKSQAQAMTAVEKLSPAVGKMLTEQSIPATAIQGSGKEGRILKGDVISFMEHQPSPALQKTGSYAVAMPATAPDMEAREERVRMTRLRQTIARRLKDAQNTAAMLTTFNEVDMTNLMEARQTYKDVFEKKHGIRLGFMSFFVKAAVAALKEIPAVNAEIDGDDIIYKNHYDIGVAVSTPSGLVVPVVRDADQMSLATVEKSIGDLAQKGRDGSLSMSDLTGGTFTITNGGVFGSLMSTPILNPPQSGILGMHKVQERPVVIKGEIKVRPMMYVALSYDHRIIDGREAVTFLVRIKENIEDPMRLLLSV